MLILKKTSLVYSKIQKSISKNFYGLYIVLDNVLKDIRGIRLDNEKVLFATGHRTKYF